MLNPGYVTFTKNADTFDGSAPARLQRMGLLMPNGKPNVQTMQVFTNIIAGQFFDDLCDYHSDAEHLASTLAGFSELAARRDYKKVYLLLSIQYDRLRKPLPDPVWWLAGVNPAVELFSAGLVERLTQLMSESTCREEAVHEQIADGCSQQ